MQAAFWPPRNWACWYPRRLRRPEDVWDRLPAPARVARVVPITWLAVALVMGPLALIGTAPSFDDWSAAPRQITDLFYTVSLPLAWAAWIALFVVPAWALRQVRGHRLGGAESLRLVLTEPTARPGFWARPHIAAVLAPVPHAAAPRRGDFPHDQLQSILRNADGLSGPLRSLGAQAAAAARQLLGSIEHADREIAELARSVEPGEDERLAAKIEALGDAAAPMRQLLEKQLELVRELSARLEAARDDRSRRVEMLKTLALHVASLRARQAEAPGDVPSLSARVRGLCEEIGSQALALAEARTAGDRTVAEAPTLERNRHGDGTGSGRPRGQVGE